MVLTQWNKRRAAIMLSWLALYFFWPLPNLKGQAVQKIDSLTAILDNHSPGDILKVNLLNQLGFEYWTIDPGESEELGHNANELAQKLNYISGQAMANRVIGVSHWSRGDFFKSLTFLFTARDLYQQIPDTLGQANSIMNIGLVYADQRDFGRALENFQYAVKLFEELEQSDRVAITYNKIGTVYLEMDDFTSAREYLDDAMAIHQNLNFSFGIMEASNRLGLLYREQGNLILAKELLSKSFQLAEENGDREHIIKNLENLASVSIRENDYSKALTYLDRALPMAESNRYLKWLRDIYNDYSQIYEAQENHRRALEFNQKYESLEDSIFSREKAAQIANLELEYQRAQQDQAIKLRDQELLYLQQRARSDRLIKIFLAILFVLLFTAAYLVFRYQRLRFRQKQLNAKRDAHTAQIELENAKLREEELRRSLEYKNKELTSYTVNFVQKNELIENIRGKLTDLQKSIPEHSKEINSLNSLIQQNANIDKDWEDFKRTFENVHHQFFTRLLDLQSELTQAELRLCALICLNLSIKESASLLGISPDSVKTARYRLRKKFNLSQEQNLDEFVMGFTKA